MDGQILELVLTDLCPPLVHQVVVATAVGLVETESVSQAVVPEEAGFGPALAVVPKRDHTGAPVVVGRRRSLVVRDLAPVLVVPTFLFPDNGGAAVMQVDSSALLACVQ